jgi:hypothetical protein
MQACQNRIPSATGRDWFGQREELGEKAYHMTRKTSEILGRDLEIYESTLDYILGREHGLKGKHPKDIVNNLQLNFHYRTLQHALLTRRKARRYKKRKTRKISPENKEIREKYGYEHAGKTIRGYWRYVYFTDEVHFDSEDLSYSAEYEYRVEGEYSDGEEYQATNNALWKGAVHVAGGITYDHKDFFTFYRDPTELSEKVYKPSRPRKSSVETEEEYQAKVELFEFEKFKAAQKAPKGNSMTMDFYVKEILADHIKFIKKIEDQYHHVFEFTEDGDPSHGMRTYSNPAARLKRDSHIAIHKYPAQSPDLNPIEAVWNIIKQRLGGRKWASRDEFKADIENEWKRVTQAQIRRRLSKMPK